MNLHLTKILVLLLAALTSYQPVFASAKSFTAKPVRLGDNLISILRHNGFSLREREKVVASDSGLRNLFLTLDTKYLIRQTATTTELRMFDSQTSASYRIVKSGGNVTAAEYKPNYDIKIVRVDGKVYGSLLGSIQSKIKSNWVATRFMDAYAFDISSFRNVSRGAKFWFTVEKLYEAGEFIKYGEVTQTSLEINGSALVKKFVRNKEGGVFFAAEDLLDPKPFYSPVSYIKIASKFKPHRLHPITKRLQPHLGIDFELPVGEPVYSVKNGVVVRYGRNKAAGNYIILLHPNGMETAYNHLHKIDNRIRQGLRVKAGEKIAEIGCTGYCTRAHLHFAVKKKGRMVDPINYLKPYPVHMEQALEARVAKN